MNKLCVEIYIKHIYKIVSKLFQADTRILILLNFSWEIPIIRRTSALPSSPPSRAHAPYSRTALPESCLTLYNKVKTAVQDRRYPRTVKDALTHLKVAERTWRRKQKIAELMILDRSRFDQVVSRMIRETGVSRLNQTTLTDRCSVEMKKPELMQKRREGILSGDIV